MMRLLRSLLSLFSPPLFVFHKLHKSTQGVPNLVQDRVEVRVRELGYMGACLRQGEVRVSLHRLLVRLCAVWGSPCVLLVCVYVLWAQGGCGRCGVPTE